VNPPGRGRPSRTRRTAASSSTTRGSPSSATGSTGAASASRRAAPRPRASRCRRGCGAGPRGARAPRAPAPRSRRTRARRCRRARAARPPPRARPHRAARQRRRGVPDRAATPRRRRANPAADRPKAPEGQQRHVVVPGRPRRQVERLAAPRGLVPLHAATLDRRVRGRRCRATSRNGGSAAVTAAGPRRRRPRGRRPGPRRRASGCPRRTPPTPGSALSEPVRNGESLVASSARTTSTPVASGSRVPPCPTRRVPSARRARATTSCDVRPSGLSTTNAGISRPPATRTGGGASRHATRPPGRWLTDGGGVARPPVRSRDDPRPRTHETVRRHGRRRRRLVRRRRRRGVRAARPERRRQDHHLRMLATLLRADAGAPPSPATTSRATRGGAPRIGVVNGGMGLYDRLTGREVLHYFGRLYDMSRRPSRRASSSSTRCSTSAACSTSARARTRRA
jgi:hypothetical protein